MATTLTPQQMKDFVRNHFEDFVNKRKADVIRRNMTADFYDHNGPDNKPTDINGDEDMMLGMYKVLPDLRLTIEHLVAEGDRVGPFRGPLEKELRHALAINPPGAILVALRNVRPDWLHGRPFRAA